MLHHVNEIMDEKFKFTGIDSFPHILMWSKYKIPLFSPIHCTFEYKFDSELTSFSPEELFPVLKNSATKENPCRGISLQWEESTPKLPDCFFMNFLENPFSYLVPYLPIRPNPFMLVSRVILLLLLMLLTCYFRQPTLRSIRVKHTLSFHLLAKDLSCTFFFFKLWLFLALWFHLICSVTCVQGMSF